MKSIDFFRGMRSWSLFAILGFMVFAGFQVDSALAQSTSANVRGQVTSEAGTALAGATVEILHVPSGTVAQAVTGDTGQFYQGGLRVGGPYRFSVTSDGYQNEALEEVYLEPGSQDPFRFNLAEASADLEAIQVTGQVLSSAVELNNGVGSTYSAREIANQPAADRDVIKTLLRDPLAQSSGVGQLSVAGVNPRFNALAIDGSLQQDDFGLSDFTYATARSPINLDAVESVSLVASDYSVTASNFTGGLVNIVTKSGSNEFDGSLYYAYNDDSFIGDEYDGDQSYDPGEFEEKEYGFTLGGPIVKDKLFFFLSYDEYETTSPANFTNSDQVNGVQPAFFSTLNGIIQDAYGLDAGGRPTTTTLPSTSERLLAKIDWNINYDHRASFTYQSTEESDTIVDPFSFESAWYDAPVDLDAYTLQLFSDWSYNFSTTLRVNFKDYVRNQNCRAGSGVGQFEFDISGDQLDGTPLEGLLTPDSEDGSYGSLTFLAGCDRFRHANEYNDERLQLFASGDYYFGDHVLTFGAEYEQFDLFNLFLASSDGRFVFENYEQVINQSPAFVDYVNVPSNNVNDGASEWGYDKLSLFVQDTWQITPDFELNYGVRYEQYVQDDEPAFNQPVFDTYGIRTDNNLDGNDLILPRVGFLWSPFERASLSGGFGLFSGGDPKVWTSNAFQPPTVFARTSGVTNADLTTVPPQLLDAVANGQGTVIDVISEDFETPSDWKASLRWEQGLDMDFGGFDLGDNYMFTAQYLYTRVKDGFAWTNLAQTQLDDALPTGVAPDGRTIYADLEDLGINNLTQLGNYDDGEESHVFTVGLGKVYDNGINFQVSYAHQDVESVTEGGSSRGISNWRGIFAADRNNPDPRTSLYQVEDAFKINFGFERNLFGNNATRVDLFGQITSGDVWSTTFDVGSSNTLFGRAGQGESPFDNNPLYIPDPSGDSSVVYASGFNQDGFFEFVESNGIPTGQIHAPYSERSSWNQRWDLRFQQEIPGIPGLDNFIGENKLKLVLDIENFLNLLDSDWGHYEDGPGFGFGQAPIVQADLVSAADVAEMGIDDAPALTGDAPRATCQAQGDCLYRYNDFDNDPTSFSNAARSVYEIRLTLRYEF